MASTLSTVSPFGCPKCLRVLEEFPNSPLSKCHGCYAILNAKVDSDNFSTDNGLAAYVKQISSASHKPKNLEQRRSKSSKESNFNGVKHLKEVETSVNGMKTLSVSGSYKLEEQSTESLEHDIKNEDCNEKLKTGFGFRSKDGSAHPYDRSFSLSDKLRRDHVTQKHLAVSSRTRSSRFSSSDEPLRDLVPQKDPAVSRRTRSRKVFDSAEEAGRDNSMKNSAHAEEQQSVAEKHSSKVSIQPKEQGVLLSSENQNLFLISKSKDDPEQVVKFHFSETDDELKIMEKVDELKIELHRMLSNKTCGKQASGISINVTHLEGKIESDADRFSSLFRNFSRQTSNSSSRNGNRRLCEESRIRHCRPVSGGAPFVVCYKCYKLLLLPADFLVWTRRAHKLRCGSCSEVLMYFFRPRDRAEMQKR
ncbi:protein ENHANCED DISEASE RESISTANCE 4-like [Phalaenopsis equestris]|uniref:protein ENHANCED DISEASE RESISTANCE 4-like n=1 Tax=Phalaenopsis equestris TaxID=78828 RepID=UPI0009E1DD00|nr:protein ENHANCED DISEASE RESISTANCE 4-like [Phalaenopsis equestris]